MTPQIIQWTIPHFLYKNSLVAQSVASLNADPGVASSFLAQSHTFMEIDHETITSVILLLPLIQERLLSVTSESMCTKYLLTACNKVKLAHKIVCPSRHDHSC